MSLVKCTFKCDWPGCTHTVELPFESFDSSKCSFDWPKVGWTHYQNEAYGPHLCKDHAHHPRNELDKVRERNKEAGKFAEQIIKASLGFVGDGMAGAKVAFNAVFPGCEDLWNETYKRSKGSL